MTVIECGEEGTMRMKRVLQWEN